MSNNVPVVVTVGALKTVNVGVFALFLFIFSGVIAVPLAETVAVSKNVTVRSTVHVVLTFKRSQTKLLGDVMRKSTLVPFPIPRDRSVAKYLTPSCALFKNNVDVTCAFVASSKSKSLL